jgi:hypothetical protein
MGGKRDSGAPRNAADPRQQPWEGTNAADTRDPGDTPLAEQPRPVAGVRTERGVRSEKDAGPSGDDAAERPEPSMPDDAGESTSSISVDARGPREEVLNDSTSSGLHAGDEEAGEQRKKLYEKGAGLVSRID